MNEQHDVDEQLARLRRETVSVRPRRGFDARVLARMQHEGRRTAWLDELLRHSTWLLPAAAATAMLSIFFAYRSLDAVDEAMTISYGVVDVEW